MAFACRAPCGPARDSLLPSTATRGHMLSKLRPFALLGLSIGLSGFLPDAAFADDHRLIDAIKARDVAAVQSLLKEKVDVDVLAPDGATPLVWAAQLDDLSLTQLLLNAGATVNYKNDFGVTALWVAARNGNAAVINLLLKAGADPNAARTSGETALMRAAMTGRPQAVEALLAGGARVDAVESRRGQNALMWAITEQHLEAARLLIAAGADVSARSRNGYTPLLFAAREGNLEIVKLLLDRGASVNETGTDGASVLHVATVRGHASLAEFLMDKGANPNANGLGYTPLHWAVWTSSSVLTHETRVDTGEWSVMAGIPDRQAKLSLVRKLMAHGADVNARLKNMPPRFGFSYTRKLLGGGSIEGATPFFLAADAGDIDIMRMLVAHGADPRIPALNNTTALMTASGLFTFDGEAEVAVEDRVKAAELCLELGVDVNAANVMGNTALHAAAIMGHDPVIKVLAEHGANMSPKNTYGETPLTYAKGFFFTLDILGPGFESTKKLLTDLGAVDPVTKRVLPSARGRKDED